MLAMSRSKLHELMASGMVRSVRVDGCGRVPVEALEEFVSILLSDEAGSHATTS